LEERETHTPRLNEGALATVYALRPVEVTAALRDSRGPFTGLLTAPAASPAAIATACGANASAYRLRPS
jgi:hypothetical protein